MESLYVEVFEIVDQWSKIELLNKNNQNIKQSL